MDLSLFVAVGIDLEGRKEALGLWTLEGRQSKAFWIQVLQDLMARGVYRVLLKMFADRRSSFVTDDFRGLGEVMARLFPYAECQLCLLHLERNLRAKLSPQGFQQARDALRRIRHARDKEEGQALFPRLVVGVKAERPGTAREMEGKREHYLAFLGYPSEVRGHIYTTHGVESLNAGIERMRLELGGTFLPGRGSSSRWSTCRTGGGKNRFPRSRPKAKSSSSSSPYAMSWTRRQKVGYTIFRVSLRVNWEQRCERRDSRQDPQDHRRRQRGSCSGQKRTYPECHPKPWPNVRQNVIVNVVEPLDIQASPRGRR